MYSYIVNDIIAFKLSSGEEMVAKFVKETENTFQILKPVTLIPSNQGIGIAQAMFSSVPENEIAVNKNLILMHTVARREIQNAYIEATTGIKTAHSILME